jgi:hypothetical protein
MWLNEAGGPPKGEVLPVARDPRVRRRKRQAWTFATLVSLVLITGFVSLGHAMRWWTIGGEPVRTLRMPCPQETALDPDQVRARVFNATGTFGLARSVARELQGRGFIVTQIGNDESGQAVTAAAVVRHGPSGKLAARSVAAQVAGQVTVQQDARESRTVDLVLGTAFRSMVPRPQASQAIAPVPTPVGCKRVTAGPPRPVTTTAVSVPAAAPAASRPASPAASKPASPAATRSVIAPAPTTRPSVPGPTGLPTAP